MVDLCGLEVASAARLKCIFCVYVIVGCWMQVYVLVPPIFLFFCYFVFFWFCLFVLLQTQHIINLCLLHRLSNNRVNVIDKIWVFL